MPRVSPSRRTSPGTGWWRRRPSPRHRPCPALSSPRRERRCCGRGRRCRAAAPNCWPSGSDGSDRSISTYLLPGGLRRGSCMTLWSTQDHLYAVTRSCETSSCTSIARSAPSGSTRDLRGCSPVHRQSPRCPDAERPGEVHRVGLGLRRRPGVVAKLASARCRPVGRRLVVAATASSHRCVGAVASSSGGRAGFVWRSPSSLRVRADSSPPQQRSTLPAATSAAAASTCASARCPHGSPHGWSVVRALSVVAGAAHPAGVDRDARTHGRRQRHLAQVAALGAGRLEPLHLVERCERSSRPAAARRTRPCR